MCGYAYEPDFLFTWPNATTVVSGGEQDAYKREHLMINSAQRSGKEMYTAAHEAQKSTVSEHFDRQSDAF